MNKFMIKINVFLVFFVLLSCDPKIKSINISEPTKLNKIPGKYLVFIDKEGWDLKKKYNFFRCKKEKFNININSIYQEKIIKIMNQTFNNISFIDYQITEKTQNFEEYDGLIEIIQNNAYSEFKFNGDFSEFKLLLYGLVKISGPQNKIFKSNISAEGYGKKEVLINCNARLVSLIAVENSLSQYIKIIFDNIYKGIRSIK